MSDIEEIVLKCKIEKVNNKTLHKNWFGWFERRKGINFSLTKLYREQMINGLVEDFYSVTDYQQQTIDKLTKEVEGLREFNHVELLNKAKNKIIDKEKLIDSLNDLLQKELIENTKLKEQLKECREKEEKNIKMFAEWLYGKIDKEVAERIVDDYLNSK